jgi:tetratricopeptide (TPR) repeat protein
MKRLALKSIACALVAASLCAGAWAQQESKPTRRKVRVTDESASAIRDAEALMEKKDFAAAEQKLMAMTVANPNDYRAWFDLGYVFSATERKEKAIEAYRRSITAQPGVLEPNLNLAFLLVESGSSEAGRYLRAAEKLKPSQEERKRIARAWVALGDALESKDRVGAVDAYQQAAEMSPEDAYPHVALGQLYEHDRDDKSAEREYKAAMAADANGRDALALLSNLYVRENRAAEAESTLREFVAKQPQSLNAHLQLGRVLAAQKKHEEAIEEFEKVLQREPTDTDAMRALAASQMALKQYDKSVSTLKVLLAKNANDADLHYAMADSLLHAHQFNEAQEEFITAAKLKPNWADPYGGLAIAASEGKDYQLAIKALDARAKLAQDTPPTYFLRATCYDNLGARKEASEAYKQFLKVAGGKYPDQEWQASHRLIAIDPETRKNHK